MKGVDKLKLCQNGLNLLLERVQGKEISKNDFIFFAEMALLKAFDAGRDKGIVEGIDKYHAYLNEKK
ncbi:MAG: hypothetical protein AAFY76_16310 [Cyanobacteria bacterium J06649_11]